MKTVGECLVLVKPSEEAGVAAPVAFYSAGSLCAWITLHFDSSLHSLNCSQEVVGVEAAGGALGTSVFSPALFSRASFCRCLSVPVLGRQSCFRSRGCQARGCRASSSAIHTADSDKQPGLGFGGGPYGCLLINLK